MDVMTAAITGARAVFSINSTNMAIASNCTYDWKHEVYPINEIDSLEIAEHAETGVTVEFSCDTFRVFGRSATSIGLQPSLPNILTQPELVVTIQDKVTGGILLALTRVKFTGRSGRVNARGVWTETLTFCAVSAFDEGTLG